MQDLKLTLKQRAIIINAIRDFFRSSGFLEVETPLLVKSPGTEPYLEVFETELKIPFQKSQPAFLLTSPEYAMKKLLAKGMGSIFQICKSFRNNEGLSERHNPEFTILEWYRVNADYFDVMKDFEEMMLFILNQVKENSLFQLEENQEKKLYYQDKVFDLTPPYPRLSVAEVFIKYVGLSDSDLFDRGKLIEACQSFGYQTDEQTTWEEAYNQLFLNKVEPELAKLDRPVFIYDYPASQAALSKKKKSDPRFAERFEVYLAGLELGNAFSELTDWQEQKQRLEEELALRKKLGKTEYQLDEEFISALKDGMPETGGIAVGVDRLVMLFSNSKSIQQTLSFSAEQIFKIK